MHIRLTPSFLGRSQGRQADVLGVSDTTLEKRKKEFYIFLSSFVAVGHAKDYGKVVVKVIIYYSELL